MLEAKLAQLELTTLQPRAGGITVLSALLLLTTDSPTPVRQQRGSSGNCLRITLYC